jgi:superfamily II DNA helicase RecQ
MHQLKQLRMIPTQFIFLTATLNQLNERKLSEMMILSNNLIVRAPVSQPNIHYQVKYFKEKEKQKQWSQILQFIADFWRKQGKKTKVLIYCMAKSNISYFMEYYDHVSTCFHADLSEEEKEANLHEFLTGSKNIMTCTSALSVGVDFEDISLVIHYQGAYSLTDFIQETGRLSRKGQVGYSVVFTTKTELVEQKQDTEERKYFRQYLGELICRRKILKLVFDNVISDECTKNEASCELCSGRELEKTKI